MKTKCPQCGKEFNAPDEYEGRKVKCTKCHFVFYAQKTEAKIDELLKKVAQKKDKGQNFISKIWSNSPAAFRISFLATLGVISALAVTALFLDWLYFYPSKPSNPPEKAAIVNTPQINPIVSPDWQWKIVGRNDSGLVIAWKFRVYTPSAYIIAGQINFLDKDGFVLTTDYFPPTEVKGSTEIGQAFTVNRLIGQQIANMQIIFKK